jgi:hypothetical protein
MVAVWLTNLIPGSIPNGASYSVQSRFRLGWPSEEHAMDRPPTVEYGEI